jgi:hypothetical protein
VTPTTWLGEWWLPGDRDRRVPGNLVVGDDDGAELHVLGSLTNGQPNGELPVVLGRTLEGGPVTLEDVRYAGSNQRSSQWLEEPVRTERLAARVAYVGEELPAESDRAFRLARLGFTDLHEWIGRGGFDEDIHDLPRVNLSYEPPPDMTAKLGFGTISIHQGWTTTGDLSRSRTIQKNVEYSVTADDAMTMSEWLSTVVRPLRHLMTFATERPNDVTSLTFTHSDQESEAVPHQIEAHYSRVSVIAAQDRAHPSEMLIAGSHLGNDLPAVLTRWFELTARTGLVIDRLLAPRYRPDTFMENRFLDVIGAAEGYHRATRSNAVLPRAAHRLRVSSIVGSAPVEHRIWLKDRLANSNEPTLHDRLVELCGWVSGLVAPVMDPAPQYVKSVVEARNAATHVGTRQRPMPAGRDLWRLTEQTTVLLEACILKDLGLDDDKASEALARTRRFRTLSAWHLSGVR